MLIKIPEIISDLTQMLRNVALLLCQVLQEIVFMFLIKHGNDIFNFLIICVGCITDLCPSKSLTLPALASAVHLKLCETCPSMVTSPSRKTNLIFLCTYQKFKRFGRVSDEWASVKEPLNTMIILYKIHLISSLLEDPILTIILAV